MSNKILSLKVLSLIIAVLLMQIGFVQTVAASTKAEKETKFAEQVKSEIAKLGTGKEAKIEIKLKDKTKLKGCVSEAGADSFTVVDTKTGATTSVEYSKVKQVKGNNLSKKVIISVVALGVLAVIIITGVLISGGT